MGEPRALSGQRDSMQGFAALFRNGGARPSHQTDHLVHQRTPCYRTTLQLSKCQFEGKRLCSGYCRLNGFAAKKCPSPSVLVVTALMTVLFGNHCHGAVSPIAFWNVTQIAGRAGFCLCPDEFSYWWQKSDWVSQLENAR